jgi:glycogen debranching enzyme
MSEENTALWNMGFKTIQELETDFGILASGKDEIYGCIFGRDSLITALKLIKTYNKNGDQYFLKLVKKILINLIQLQGKDINIESGEEPGKIIHEYRTHNYEHLVSMENPWYLYADNTIRNYDSVDSTPLFLIAAYRYFQASHDISFLEDSIESIHKALAWITLYGDSNGDGFIDYSFNPDRKFGGLHTQSWMDSSESIFHEDGTPTSYPIAPLEVQGYAYLAFTLWSKYFADSDSTLSINLSFTAKNLKEKFNEKFVIPGDSFQLASAIDGSGKPLLSVRSSMGHILWAAQTKELDGISDCILSEEHVPRLVERLLCSDLFEPNAGMRTLSKHSANYDPRSYHNGSIWPHDTAMVATGFENFGYLKESDILRKSLRLAWKHFGTPIELFVYTEGEFQEYQSKSGQKACVKQAWSAASILAEI